MHGELLIDRLDRQILRLKLGSDVDGDPEGLRAVLLRDGRTVVEDRRRLALAGTAGRRATRDGGRIGDADASGSVPDAVVGWGGKRRLRSAGFRPCSAYSAASTGRCSSGCPPGDWILDSLFCRHLSNGLQIFKVVPLWYTLEIVQQNVYMSIYKPHFVHSPAYGCPLSLANIYVRWAVAVSASFRAKMVQADVSFYYENFWQLRIDAWQIAEGCLSEKIKDAGNLLGVSLLYSAHAIHILIV